MKTTRSIPDLCPSCGTVIDSHSHPHKTPKPGDFTICAYCASVLRYGGGLVLLAATEADLADLDEEDRRVVASTVARVRLLPTYGRRPPPPASG